MNPGLFFLLQFATGNILDLIKKLLEAIWQGFGELVQWLMRSFNLSEKSLDQFDKLLLELIKISLLATLLILCVLLFWTLFNRIIRILKSVLLYSLGLLMILLILFLVRTV
jgi:hypothetical protein